MAPSMGATIAATRAITLLTCPHKAVPSSGFGATALVKYALNRNVTTIVGKAELAQSNRHQAMMADLFPRAGPAVVVSREIAKRPVSLRVMCPQAGGRREDAESRS